jgi:hypothetical protein
MKADWVRLWHDMPSDPKWRTIARKSRQRVGDVIAVFSFMLTNASAAAERGTLDGWDSEDIATALDLDAADVDAIMTAMQGKTLDGQRLTGWDKRQPKREDSTAADRQRDKREREKQSRDADDSHALSRSVTQSHDLEERRGEREEKEKEEREVEKPHKAVRATRLKADFTLPSDWRAWAISDRGWSRADVDEEAACFTDFWHAKAGRDGAKLDWLATWRNWCRNSKRMKGVGASRMSHPQTDRLGLTVPC